MTIHLDHRINLPPSFNLVYYQVALPKCLQRACVFDSWPPPATFPSSLIALKWGMSREEGENVGLEWAMRKKEGTKGGASLLYSKSESITVNRFWHRGTRKIRGAASWEVGRENEVISETRSRRVMLSECTAQGTWIEVRGKERWGVGLAENWLVDP